MFLKTFFPTAIDTSMYCHRTSNGNGLFKVSVSLITKGNGRQNSWSLGNCSSNQMFESHMTQTTSCCLTAGNYTLKCMDSGGDGWSGGFITVQGKKYCEHFDTGNEVSEEVFVNGMQIPNFVWFVSANTNDSLFIIW